MMLSIFESYVINQIKVQRYIGTIDKHLKWNLSFHFNGISDTFRGVAKATGGKHRNENVSLIWKCRHA